MKDQDSSSVDVSARRGYWALLGLLGGVLFATHWRPALAWPLQGFWAALAVLGLAALAALTGKRLGGCWGAAARPAWALGLFTFWVAVRTFTGINWTEGLLDVSSYLNGLIFFGLGIFIVRGAETLETDPARGRSKGALAVALFFWGLSVSIALHGLWEYHVFFPRQLAEQHASGIWNPDDVIEGAVLLALTEMRVRSLFGNPNVLCGFLAFTYPLIAAAAWELIRQPALSRSFRGLTVFLFGISSSIIFYTAFRTGSVGGGLVFLTGLTLIGGAVAFGYRRHKKLTLPPAFPILTLLFGLFLCLPRSEGAQTDQNILSSKPIPAFVSDPSTIPADTQGALWKGIRQSHTIPQRLYYCRIGLKIWLDAPLIGHGSSGYQTLYLKYRRVGEGETRYAHNFIVQLLADTGLIGLGLFLGFLVLLALQLWRGIREKQPSALVWATGAAVFLFLLDSMGEYTFCTREGYQDFALLAGLFCASVPVRQREQALPSTEIGHWGKRLLPPVSAILILLCFWFSTVSPFMARYHLQNADNAIQMFQTGQHPVPAETPRNEYWRDAFDEIGRALRWFPQNAEALQKRAALYRMAQQEHLAERDLREAGRLDPYSASLRAQLAESLWQQGRHEEALDMTAEAIERHPVKSPHYLLRARYLEALGYPEEARHCVEQAVRLAFMPQEKNEAQRALKRLEGQIR